MILKRRPQAEPSMSRVGERAPLTGIYPISASSGRGVGRIGVEQHMVACCAIRLTTCAADISMGALADLRHAFPLRGISRNTAVAG